VSWGESTGMGKPCRRCQPAELSVLLAAGVSVSIAAAGPRPGVAAVAPASADVVDGRTTVRVVREVNGNGK